MRTQAAHPPIPVAASTVDEALTLLREHGGRVTPARRYLLQALFDRPGHRTAEDLADEVRSYITDVNISTIYRNLDELERIGVVAQMYLGHGPALYHLTISSHGHLVCEACGATIEVPDTIFRSLCRSAQSGFGFAVNTHHLAVPGRCQDCQKLLDNTG